MIRETARVIDQTAPHQLVVAKVLGALNCTDRLRVIKTEGAHPFAATTDGMADMRGAADLVVSFDGGFKYGLAIEVKTTTQTAEGAGPFQLFKAVKNIERNQRQFDRLIGSTPAWWYIVVHIGKLTAKTVSDMDRALLDCPTVIFEGRHADATPDEVLGVKPLGELLDLVGDRLKLLGTLAPLPSPQVQLDLMDHVPVVTLDTPLKAPVWTAPLKVIDPASVVTPVPTEKRTLVIKRPRPKRRVSVGTLADTAMDTLVGELVKAWDKIGETAIKERAARYPELLDVYAQMKADKKSALSHILSSHYLHIVALHQNHDALFFALALTVQHHGLIIAHRIMPELNLTLGDKTLNVLNRIAHDISRQPSRDLRTKRKA